MNFASDFRRTAREALGGKWLIAVAVGLVAVILGGTGTDGTNGIKLNLNISDSGTDAGLEFAGHTIFSFGSGLDSGVTSFLAGAAVFIALAAIIAGVIYFVLGSVIAIGYSGFNLNLVDHNNPGFETLFAFFSHWKTAAAARFLKSLYTLLWTLLFIIPGIVASYSYAMTEYILAENPNMTAGEAIAVSKEMMTGNRWRLFCLQISFIGWSFLCSLTLGIGNLWLTPYKNAATAAFYREVSGTAANSTER